MDNPEDISDLTTIMNMTLVIMAYAFKLNYTTLINNNQRISSNPRNRQITQLGNQIAQNARQNLGFQNVGNKNGLIVVPMQASTSGTHGNTALIYDSDNSAEIGNVKISRVYYVEGLGHNLFLVDQFCDSDLEVAFWKHTCFVRNLEVAAGQPPAAIGHHHTAGDGHHHLRPPAAGKVFRRDFPVNPKIFPVSRSIQPTTTNSTAAPPLQPEPPWQPPPPTTTSSPSEPPHATITTADPINTSHHRRSTAAAFQPLPPPWRAVDGRLATAAAGLSAAKPPSCWQSDDGTATTAAPCDLSGSGRIIGLIPNLNHLITSSTSSD
nr:integrase, catalytic region, zinc finger, CCHC-type, peptidase aspartic, catalytic [Tanacetum cinerariifolium]